MNDLKWQRELKRIFNKVPFNITEEWDFDAYNRRIPGQFGEYVIDHVNPNENLCVCIDISEPVNFNDDYAEIIEYLESLRDIRNKFKKINFNFWAVDYYLSESIWLNRTIGLVNKIEGYYKKAMKSIDTSKALASNIFKPLAHGSNWYRLKPALILVLTEGKIINDIEHSFKIEIMRNFNKTFWICLDDVDENYLSTILDIDSSAQKRIILAKE